MLALIPWRQDIPFPTDARDGLNNVQEQGFVYDLVALTYGSILHEYKHVHILAEEKNIEIPQEKDEEELACDSWSSWIYS